MTLLSLPAVKRAVHLQATAYKLLKWLERALQKGFIAPEAVHEYTSLADSTQAWLELHLLNLPSETRPPKEDLRAFSSLFSTFLTSTFDLALQPGTRLYSTDAHCFCPFCSWLIRAPHLKPKTVRSTDKKTADNLRRKFVLGIAAESERQITAADVDAMIHDPAMREAVSLCAYAHDLLQRLEGNSVGAASLALWRSFAWTPEGSPKKNFRLTAEAIMSAQARVKERVEAM